MDAPGGVCCHPRMVPDEIADLLAAATPLATPCGAGSMAWHRFGAAEAPKLVLLHGGFGSFLHFTRAIPLLLPRWQVFAADLPGLGDSADAPAPYSAESIAAIVTNGVRRLLGETRFTLAGFSFGGLIGGHVAATLGHQVERFVFFGPGGLGLPRGHHAPLLQWRAETDPARVADLHAENLRRFMIRDPARVDATAIWIQTENTRRARTKSRPIAATDTLARALPLVVAPKLGAWGDRDLTAWPFLDSRRALMAEVGAEYLEIPDCGHWAPYEQPAACVELMEEWSRP
jgi:pimeloyl-ACP methyl ester carboxylesterase